MHNYKQISRILSLILFANLFVSIAKLVVGYLVNSESITADGFHSLTDSTSNVVGLIGIRIASKPADKNHPYGHKKFETLSGLFIGVMLLFITIEIITGAVNWFLNPVVPNVNLLSIGVMVVTLMINIFISTYEYRKAKELNSDILLSDSLNTRSDIFVSLSVLATLIGIRLGLPPIIDPIASLVVAGVIVFASIEIFKSTTGVLVDKKVLDSQKIKEIVISFPKVIDVDNIRSRGRFDDIFVDLHLMIQKSTTIDESHELIHDIEEKLRKEINPSIQLITHLEPVDDKE